MGEEGLDVLAVSGDEPVGEECGGLVAETPAYPYAGGYPSGILFRLLTINS
jgi:hypothetical protein